MFSRIALIVSVLGAAAACSEATPPPAAERATPAPVQSPMQAPVSDVLAEASVDESRSPAEVRWDAATKVRADFNSDGVSDEAVVGYVEGGLLLAIDMGQANGSHNRSLMSFGIGQSQDSICAAPATLRKEEACAVDGDPLPGCRQTTESSGLALGDRNGDCDAIHLYWDHEQNRMSWWRN